MFVVRDEERFPGHLAFTRCHLGGHTGWSIGEIVEEDCLTIVLSSVLYLHLCWCVCACARVPAGTHLFHCTRPFIQPFVSCQFSSGQSLSHVRFFATPWIAACQASLSITNSRSLLMSIKSVMPSNHLILCHPLLLLP